MATIPIDAGVHAALYAGHSEPKPAPAKRRGSGSHHQIQVPRQKLTHLLAEAMAHAEVNHAALADSYAHQLVAGLIGAKILRAPDADKEGTK